MIEAFLERLSALDFAAAAELLSVDFVHHTQGLGNGDRVGREAWLDLMRSLWTSFPDRRLWIHQIVGEGERVAVRLTWTGTHMGVFAGIAPTRREVEVNGMSVFALREGKIVEQWTEQDILALHQQLGAAPGHSDNWPRDRQPRATSV
jgi:steroid delta-isomerase-like uncharacterized protein